MHPLHKFKTTTGNLLNNNIDGEIRELIKYGHNLRFSFNLKGLAPPVLCQYLQFNMRAIVKFFIVNLE